MLSVVHSWHTGRFIRIDFALAQQVQQARSMLEAAKPRPHLWFRSSRSLPRSINLVWLVVSCWWLFCTYTQFCSWLLAPVSSAEIYMSSAWDGEIDRLMTIDALLIKASPSKTSVSGASLMSMLTFFLFSFFLFTKVDACPRLNYVKNGVTYIGRSDNFYGQYGERRTVGCPRGLFAYGGLNQRKTIFCQMNGQWSSNRPPCEGKYSAFDGV